MIDKMAAAPDDDNVAGLLNAPRGLATVAAAVGRTFGQDLVSVYRSGFDGTETLRVRTASAEFETTHLGGDEYLFNGGVGGSPAEVEAFLRRLSASLAADGIGHQFEVYGGDGGLLFLFPQAD